jgi:glutamate-ammonia-ligase adenylyltransferase
LKERIERQLSRKRNTTGNVKLAPGGIRDIEFIVQSLQLEVGLHQANLQTGNTLEALSRLTAAEYLTEADAAVLVDAYKFLRVIEHRMQMMNNRQVHQLPEDEEACFILARTLAYRAPDEGDQLREDYNEQARKVREIFDRILPSTED